MVDAGYSGYWPRVAAALEALALPVGAVRAVIITHTTPTTRAPPSASAPTAMHGPDRGFPV